MIEGHARAVLCPRCGYDLHGLAKSRCPECGLSYDPATMRESATVIAQARVFEFRWREHPFKSLLGTILHSMRPRRFWSSLHPWLPVRFKPLLVYLLTAYALLCTLAAAAVAYQYAANTHPSYWNYLTGNGRMNLPRGSNPHTWFFSGVWRQFRWQLSQSARAFPFFAFCTLMTAASLMAVTRLRHAEQLMPRQISIRVAVYSMVTGLAWWKLMQMIPVLLLGTGRFVFESPQPQSRLLLWLHGDTGGKWQLGLAVLIFTWFVAAGLKHHVRLPRPWIAAGWTLGLTGLMILAVWVVARAWLGWRLWSHGERLLTPIASWFFGL